MDHLKQSWAGIGILCPFCRHSKCDACSDICSSLLACCRYRARAVSRIESLQTTSNLEKLTLVRCGR